MYLSLNPFNQVLIKRFDSATDEMLANQCLKSQEAFEKWRTIPINERNAKIAVLSQNLEKKKDAFAAVISSEMGKPFIQAKLEIEKSIFLCNHYVGISEKVLKANSVKMSDKDKAQVKKEPLGAILGIMPWNFPVWQSFRFAIPAILSGNVVLLKPASNTPQCGLMIADLFTESDMPEVLQAMLADTQQIEKVIAHPAVQGVSLTGSDKAGAIVASLAGKHIKKTVLELGGNDPFIVLADADVAKAARFAVKSRFNNNGQTCNAAKRWIVDEKIAPKFIEKITEEISKMHLGDPFDPNTGISCLARTDIAETLQQQVDDSVKKGAEILISGGKENKSSFFKPMVLKNVKPGMPAYHEELFGPVGLLFTFTDIEDAIRLANDTVYGLCAAVWTKDKKIAASISDRLNVGYVAINNMVVSDPRLPFGGVKRSGFGRELGNEGLLEFVNIKTIVGS